MTDEPTARLTPRQREFLVALHVASWRASHVFRADSACRWLALGNDECDELYRWAEKSGLLNRLPDGEVILTTDGYALAARLRGVA